MQLALLEEALESSRVRVRRRGMRRIRRIRQRLEDQAKGQKAIFLGGRD